MKINLTIGGFVLFIVSFFLPAYYGVSGYDCAEAVFKEMGDIHLIDFQKGVLMPLYQVTSYLFFNLSNTLMVVLPVLLLTMFRNRPIPTWVIVAQFVLLLNVLHWPVFHLIADEESISDIDIGYYVWLVSMCLVLAASWLSRKRSSKNFVR